MVPVSHRSSLAPGGQSRRDQGKREGGLVVLCQEYSRLVPHSCRRIIIISLPECHHKMSLMKSIGKLQDVTEKSGYKKIRRLIRKILYFVKAANTDYICQKIPFLSRDIFSLFRATL